MTDIYENYNISLGIKKNGKFITIKKPEEKSNKQDLEKIFKKHKENTEILKIENEKLEKQLLELQNENKIEKNSMSSEDYNMDDNIIVNKNTIIDLTNLEIESISIKSDNTKESYNIEDINFNNIKKVKEINKETKKYINNIKKIRKMLLSELKKYFKKNKLDVSNELDNINNLIEKSKYDDLQLSYDLDLVVNKYCTLLKFDIKSNNLIIDYFNSELFINKSFEKINLSKYDNNYKTLKIISQYLNLDFALINTNLEVIDEIFKKRKNKIYFLLNDNKIYALNKDFHVYYKFKNKIVDSINSCNKRDIEKNSILVLFDELHKYKEHYIHFPQLKYSIFKYNYLLDDIYMKKVKDLTIEQIDILKYLVQNFGLHFYLFNDIRIIKKTDFTLEFILKHPKYCIDGISLFDYKHYNKSEILDKLDENDIYYKYEDFNYYYAYNNVILKGITKDEVYKKCFDKFNIKLNLDEIKKNLSYMDLHNINSQLNIDKILSLFPNMDYLFLFNSSDKKILSIEYMNFDNPLSFDYILKLSEKIKICKICNCELSINPKISNFISIDAVNPLLGHTINKNNIDLLCGKCNITKGTCFYGKYSEKPYFYDIKCLKRDKLEEILKYHKLETSGITYVLRQRLEKYIKNIDNY